MSRLDQQERELRSMAIAAIVIVLAVLTFIYCNNGYSIFDPHHVTCVMVNHGGIVCGEP
jgi:hypothetical protein